MFRTLWTSCGLALGLAWAPVAAAQEHSPAFRSDLECAIVGLSLAGTSENTEQQQAGTMFALFYIGRLQGRMPEADLETAIYDLAVTLAPADLDPWRQRCAVEFSGVGRQLLQMGSNMQRRVRGDSGSATPPKSSAEQ